MKTGLNKYEILEVELELTGECNLECSLCIRSYEYAQHLNVKHMRPLNELIAHLDSFPNLRYACLSGAVSEPTMYDQFLELIRYLNFRNINYDLYTNANTHEEDWWEELGTLIVHPKNRVLFTVCGTTQKIHEKYQSGSSLEQVLKNARAFRKSGTTTDWIQLIRFEYNKDNLESDDMKKITEEFNHLYICESAPYQERFNIIKDTNTDIRMAGKLGEKYNVIKNAVLKRYDSGTKCTMKCKSFELKYLFVDNFGGEHPCFLHRVYDKTLFDHNDYSNIFKFKNKYCYECESMTKTMLESNGMERMG